MSAQPSNPETSPSHSPLAVSPPSPQPPCCCRFGPLQDATEPDTPIPITHIPPQLRRRPFIVRCELNHRSPCARHHLPPRHRRPYFVLNPKHKEATIYAACSHLRLLQLSPESPRQQP
ncbi:hypothetical protein PIB30_079103 [Stylosanthes scabra]|uniref:Uncharacterized protein n=1 Tax=Stylosanthes scabra TaxID=79078 RepID=A0ABU6UQH5_9FABA|nr:hypothetical protein [Stylosanthes scabra]